MSARPFLITGLPRSRTAWLSVLCTTGDSICYHEPTSTMNDIKELADVYDKPSLKYVGASDSGLGFFLPWVMEAINPRTVIIDRGLDEVRQSLVKCGITKEGGLRMLMDCLNRYKYHPSVLWVPYKALDNKRWIEKIWMHLMPGLVFDEGRYEQLAHMNITVDIPHKIEHYHKQGRSIRNLCKSVDWGKYYVVA